MSGTSGVSSSSSSSSSGIDPQEQALLDAEQKQFEQNFELQTQQAMNDNNNSTATAIATSHAQTFASETAAARETGEANSKIVA